MIKLGIVDCDTSHTQQFTMRHNHIPKDKNGIEEDQWVDGCQVVAAYRGTSAVVDDERIDGYVKQLREWGVEIVEDERDLIGKVDGVLIESNQGSQHLKHAKIFMEAGLPCYIDKPFANSADDALAIRDLAAKYNVPFFSSSSLRYAPECVAAKAELGTIFGVDAWSPASLHEASPGLAHYGIHGVEILFTLMGAGCEAVSCAFNEEIGEVNTAKWSDGRIGVMRGTRKGSHAYGFVAWGESEVRTSGINTAYIYRELCKQQSQFFETGKSPIDPNETIELVCFMDAALESSKKGGAWVQLKK
ncbi:MAG: Gfo/Idh/MocA family oxidoreductase [Armatimonadia bacterium]